MPKSQLQEWLTRNGYKDASHLGDGLYASHDGYVIWLSAERDEGVHYVGVEPDVFRNLLNWVRKTEQKHDTPGLWSALP